MRKLITTIIIAVIMTVTAFAASPFTLSTKLYRFNIGFIAPDIEDPPYGDRMPSRPVGCTISDGAVNIDGVDTDDITNFEVRDTDDNALVIFDNETDFTDYVFSLSGDYRVAFNTSDYTYMG